MKKLWLCIILITTSVQANNEGVLTTPVIETVKTADFNQTYLKIRKEEGFYVNDPDDLGKETYCGITKKHNKDWLGWYYVENTQLKTNQRVTGKDSLITEILVKDFYLDIWVKEGFYQLTNQEVANYLFDMRVHMYRTQTIKLINRTFDFNLDKRKVDWVIPQFDTLNIEELKQTRVNYYLKLIKLKPNQIKFKKNWIKRANR